MSFAKGREGYDDCRQRGYRRHCEPTGRAKARPMTAPRSNPGATPRLWIARQLLYRHIPRMRAPTSTRNSPLLAHGGRARLDQRPRRLFEQAEKALRNEARARRIDVAVALRVLAMREEALRHDQMQIVLGARHRDIEQPALLLDLGRGAGAEIGRDAAVDDVEHEHRFPFLALGGMDGREDQIVLVEQRHAGLVAGGVRRIERQFGQEPLARRIAGGDLLELHEIGAARGRILVDALEMRLVPEPRALDLGRPADCRARRRCDSVSTKPCQSSPARGGGGSVGKRRDRIGASAMRSSTRCADAGPTPGSSCSTRKPATRSRGFSAKRSSASMSLTCAAVEEFQPAELDEGNVAAGQLDLQRAAVMRGAEQHRLLLQRRARLAVLQHALDDVARLVGLVAHGDQLRPLADWRVGPEVLGEALARPARSRHWRRRGSAASSGSCGRA